MAVNFHPNTPSEVVQILASAIKNRSRLVLVYGDAKTGKEWDETETGFISQSNDPHGRPILLAGSNSKSGTQILDHCIVQIRSSDAKVLWQHPLLINPEYTMRKGQDHVFVLRDSQPFMRFDSMKIARRWARKFCVFCPIVP